MDGQSTAGYWWSTLAYSSDNAYGLGMASSVLNTQYNNGKTYTFALRCTTYNNYLSHLLKLNLMFRTPEKNLHSTGSTKARRYPLSYIFSGSYYWGDGTLYSQGAVGNWWSTSGYSSTNAYYLRMYSSGLDPQYNASKAFGLTLRCAAQNFFFQKF